MTTKKTRSKRKKSDLSFRVLMCEVRHQNLVLLMKDAITSLYVQLDELRKEVKHLKGEKYESKS